MKKILLIAFCCLCLVGCGEKKAKSYIDEEYEIIESHNSYNIYEKKDDFKYYYTINTLSGILYESEKLSNRPDVKEYENSVIEISISHGNAGLKKYFDINNSLISADYIDVLESNGVLCVYINPSNLTELIIQDIFNKDRYYKTIAFEFELKPTSIEKVKIDEKNSIIKIIYYNEKIR